MMVGLEKLWHYGAVPGDWDTAASGGFSGTAASGGSSGDTVRRKPLPVRFESFSRLNFKVVTQGDLLKGL